jgi:hypothetical protein
MFRTVAWMSAILALVDQLLCHGLYTQKAELMLSQIIARV